MTDYTYDDLYRLTRETKEDDQQSTIYDYSYEYDAVGSRTKKTDEETQTDTNYTNNNMNQMTAAGNITHTYDSAGNMATKVVSQQTTTYTWDFRNKMLKVDFPTGNDPVMRYDGDGRRVKKAMGATTTKFLYVAGGLSFETDGSDNEVAEYRRASGGGLLAMERSSTVYWYHFDHLGSSRALTNSSETVTDTRKYDAWGNTTASSGSTTNPLEFVGALGYYHDVDAGLLLLSARYYDAPAGRFLSVDPARVAVNWYEYAYSRPLTLVDPTGRSAILPIIGIGVLALIWALAGAHCAMKVNDGVGGLNPVNPPMPIPGTPSVDKWMHCYANCLITKYCGPEFGLIAIPATELEDQFCGGSGWNWADFWANKDGFECGLKERAKFWSWDGATVSRNCDTCCVQAGYPRLWLVR